MNEHPRGRVQTDTVMDCGRCDNHIGWSDTGAGLAVILAREDGWTHTRKYGWVCPDCSLQLLRLALARVEGLA